MLSRALGATAATQPFLSLTTRPPEARTKAANNFDPPQLESVLPISGSAVISLSNRGGVMADCLGLSQCLFYKRHVRSGPLGFRAGVLWP